MNIHAELPLKVCLNLERREDRRRYVSEHFRMRHLKVLRWPALDGSRSRHKGAFSSPARRAKHLSFLQVIRRARSLGSAALLFLEDDVVLHPDFTERAAALEVPDDWGMLYFGCLHVEAPTRIAHNLVRVTRAYDTHAVAIRGCWFDTVMSLLGPKALREKMDAAPQASDALLAGLQDLIPSYAASPNLAWQRMNFSDMSGEQYSHYSETGVQVHFLENLGGMHQPE